MKNFLNIKGFIPTSLVDWDGKVSAVIFLSGCNFKCHFCSNKELVLNPEKINSISFDEIKNSLEKNKDFIDGIVITGGEPTIHDNLVDLCKELRKLNFKIKIDTNGSKPEIIKELLDKKLIDYVAMDIKAPFDKYNEITDSEIDLKKIKESINIISKSSDYEFRITLFPKILEKDLVEIAKYLKEMKANKSFFIQQFKPEDCINKDFEKIKPYTKEEMERFYNLIKKYFDKCGLRNI